MTLRRISQISVQLYSTAGKKLQLNERDELSTRVDAREFQNLSGFVYYRLIHWVACPDMGESDQGLHRLQLFWPVIGFFRGCPKQVFKTYVQF